MNAADKKVIEEFRLIVLAAADVLSLKGHQELGLSFYAGMVSGICVKHGILQIENPDEKPE